MQYSNSKIQIRTLWWLQNNHWKNE